MAAHYSRRSPGGELLFVLAMRNTLRALFRMHEAREERDQALRIEEAARGDLARVMEARQQMQQSPGALPSPAVDHGRDEGRRGPDRQGPDAGR